MTKYLFRCTLLSDVVISKTAATEKKHQTLDYIPGSYFLGIVAKKLYTTLSLEAAKDLFHNGTVHFGDGQLSLDGTIKALKTPLSLHEYKDQPSLDKWQWGDVEIKSDLQPKQVRVDYLQDGKIVKVDKSYHLRTAIENGTAKEASLFGYQSIKSGQRFVFEVLSTRADLLEIVGKALEGPQHLGKSKSAAYGLVAIEALGAAPIETKKIKAGSKVRVYAEGNWAFFDDYGHPTFQPTPEQLGIPGGIIDWESSFLQTRNFALYNSKRATRDADIYAIEKGSVMVVKTTADVDLSEGCIGAYQAIGFGKVQYNPEWPIKIESKTDAPSKSFAPPFEVKGHSEDLGKFNQLTERRQHLLMVADAKEFLRGFQNYASIKKISGSQWSSLEGILDRLDDELKIEMGKGALSGQEVLNQAEKLKTQIFEHITTDARRTGWEESGANRELENVFKKAKERFLDPYEV